jgi:hypothetical protein
MDKEKELHKVLKYLENCLVCDAPLSTNALRKTIDLLNEYKRLVTVKDKDASHHRNNRKVLRDLYNKRYNQKSMEMTGRAENEDGKLILPRWDAKTNSLLKLDYEEHGFNTMQRYIELFFSDQVEAVANFTNKVNKAGYSYSVFHSMIPKMVIFKGKPNKPCEFCGKRNGHSASCPETKKLLEQIENREKERETIRADLQNVSLTNIFSTNIRGGSHESNKLRSHGR